MVFLNTSGEDWQLGSWLPFQKVTFTVLGIFGHVTKSFSVIFTRSSSQSSSELRQKYCVKNILFKILYQKTKILNIVSVSRPT